MDKQRFNPYNTTCPASGSMFLGRQDLVHKALASQGSFATVGFPRMGKSSLLKAVAQAAQESGVTVAYLPLAGSDEAELAGHIDHYLLRQDGRMRDAAIATGAGLQRLLSGVDRYCQERADDHEPGASKVMIILDETERLFRDQAVVEVLGAMGQELQHVRMVYTLFPSVYAEMQGSSSRFDRTITHPALLPFDEAQTGRLVRLCESEDVLRQAAGARVDEYRMSPWMIEDDAAAKVYRQTGGFPCLIQGLMGAALDAVETGQVTLDAITQASEGYYAMNLLKETSNMWNRLTGLQKDMIRTVSRAPSPVTYAGLIDATRASHEDNPSAFVGAMMPLAEQGNGIFALDDGRYAIRGGLLQRAFADLLLFG
ncbi:hypothetical protein AUJ68_02510 [Candidatus Woesearchaeota archaeon CG1_02_57_44]|nr:MAG: hypothetical protein AUJ68_02510 [Candidatus Woesearchaeota archaeon CG1_02_57_44]